MGTLLNYTWKNFIQLAPVQTAGILAGEENAFFELSCVRKYTTTRTALKLFQSDN